MSYKKIIVCVIIVLFGLFFYLNGVRNDEAVFNLGLCTYPDTTCAYNTVIGVVKPLQVVLLGLSLSLLFLLFASEQAFKAWRKFALVAIPVGAILLWLAPTNTPGGFGISFFSYTKESASWLVSGAFLVASFVVIVRNRRMAS